MSDEKIETLHPEVGKQGVNINRAKYEQVKAAILTELHQHDEITFKALTQNIDTALKSTFDGSVPWYVVTVKLDLEARKLIERVPGKAPQRLRLAQ